ncbi:hypothetical protein LJC68_09570 [Bacteroidales bacterium OttesenSCG-928-B11]|nr:hypothetical protein [Bacteroidales bacterium OttesenSCG-928-B11]
MRSGCFLQVKVSLGDLNAAGKQGTFVLLETLHIDVAGVPENEIVLDGGDIEREKDVTLHPLGGESVVLHLQADGGTLGDKDGLPVNDDGKHYFKTKL